MVNKVPTSSEQYILAMASDSRIILSSCLTVILHDDLVTPGSVVVVVCEGEVGVSQGVRLTAVSLPQASVLVYDVLGTLVTDLGRRK